MAQECNRLPTYPNFILPLTEWISFGMAGPPKIVRATRSESLADRHPRPWIFTTTSFENEKQNNNNRTAGKRCHFAA